MELLTEVRWSPHAVGIGIGILSCFSFLVCRKPLACSTSFAKTSGMIERLFSGKKVDLKPYYQKIGLAVDWEWMLVKGIIIGSLISALLSGDFHWQWVPSLWAAAFGGNPYLRVIVALVGGACIGFGARWAGGCTSGHAISGLSTGQWPSLVAAVSFYVGGLVMTHLVLPWILRG